MKPETSLPLPPVPPDLDLRAFPKMFMDTGIVLGSELADAEKTTPDAFRAAILLQFMSWQNVPASSIPGDERRLAALIGVSTQKWKTIRECVLKGFVLCSDGRFYHEAVVEEALAASSYRSKQRARANKRWQPQASLNLGDNLGITAGKPDATAFPIRSRSSSSSPLDQEEAFLIPQWVPKDSWTAFSEMRRSIKAPMTSQAMKLIVAELTRISGPTGADAGAILDQSTRNSWKDVYPLKNRSAVAATSTDLQGRNSAAAAAFATANGGAKR